MFAEAAWKLGSAGGSAALTVRAIADEMRVSAGLLYSHFEDKAALMTEVQHLASPRLAAALDAGPRDADGPTVLSQLCLAYMRFVRDHAWIYGDAREGPEPWLTVATHRQMFFERAAAILVAVGAPKGASLRMAEHLWVGVHGLVAMRAWSIADDAFVDAHVRLLLRGLLAPEEDSPAPRRKTKSGKLETVPEPTASEEE